MKSFVSNLSLCIICILASVTASAGGSTGWLKIEAVNQRDCSPNRGLEVAFTTTHRNPDACSNARIVEVSCGLNTYKQLLAMILTAQSGSMQVDAYVSGCDAQGQAKVTALKIR